jgi:transposase
MKRLIGEGKSTDEIIAALGGRPSRPSIYNMRNALKKSGGGEKPVKRQPRQARKNLKAVAGTLPPIIAILLRERDAAKSRIEKIDALLEVYEQDIPLPSSLKGSD